MNGELQEEFISTNINPALRRLKTTPADDNRLSLADIKANQASWNNSKLVDPTSNLHLFGYSLTRRQRNLKRGYRLGSAHATTMSCDNEEMNYLEISDSDDERIDSCSESGDAESVEDQTGPVSFDITGNTLSIEGNTSLNMNENNNLSQSCKTSDPQYCEKSVDESKNQTELPPCDQLNSSEGSVMTNSLLNSSDHKMCVDVPNMDQPSNDDTPNSEINLTQEQQDYLSKLRRKRTVIEEDNRLAFYDCHIKKDKVSLQTNQNEQMNSESKEASVTNTTEPKMEISCQENSNTAIESKTSKELVTVQHYETGPELDQEQMAFLSRLKKIKTKFTDDNRFTFFFQMDTILQDIPKGDKSGPCPVSGRNRSVSKGQTHLVPVSDRQMVKDKANEDKHFRPVQNQPASADSKSNRSTKLKNNNEKTSVSAIGKNSHKANHRGPLSSMISNLQRSSGSETTMNRTEDKKITERKTPETSLKSGPSSNVPPAQKRSQRPTSQGKTSDLENYAWYYKDISRKQSETVLRAEGNDGCFMVRDSSRPGMYTISLFSKTRRRRGQVKYYLIYKSMDDKFYLVKEQEFSTIPELVDYYKLDAGCLITRLGNPPIRKNDDIVRTSTEFGNDSDSDVTSSSSSSVSVESLFDTIQVRPCMYY